MKYYAVRKGRVPGIYLDWDKCRAQVDGFKGAEFKSFSSEADAKNYLRKSNLLVTDSRDKRYDLIAYVDGSCLPDGTRYASGIIILDPENNIKMIKSFSENDPDYVSMRNVAGEILAATEAIRFALSNHSTRMKMCYDYEGIQKWCTGEWSARKLATRAYRDSYISATMTSLWIDFCKIKSHSNDLWNDVADQLAKSALGMLDPESVLYSIVDGLYKIYLPKDYTSLSDLLLTKAAGIIMDTQIKANYINIEDYSGKNITYTIKEV